MRITNTIMHKNSLENLNKNKVSLDKLNTQQVTGKKITRPSDDPIIAIRALRLRANLAQVTQFHDRNVADANAWLDATRGAIENTAKVISDIHAAYTQAANGTNNLEDRKALQKVLEASRDQIYANADADYADRTIFTGYRTASKVTFQTDEMVIYKDITEGFNASDLEDIKYISGRLDMKRDIVDFDQLTDAYLDQVENNVKDNKVTRIRLAYDDLDKIADDQVHDLIYRESFSATSTVTGSTLTVNGTKDDGNGGTTPVTFTLTRQADGTYVGAGTTTCVRNEDGTYLVDDGNSNFVHLTASGKVIGAYEEKTVPVTVTSIASGDAARDAAYDVADDEIHFIPETGELIIGSEMADTLRGLKDIDGTDTIEFAYDKSDWKKGDLRPEHYFNCKDETDPDPDKHITYTSHEQEICYDVSANQSMRVNTLASDIFLHAIGRDVDEMLAAIEDADAADDKVKALEERLEDSTLSDDEKKALNKLLDAAKKEQTFAQGKVQNLFEAGQTSFQEYDRIATLAGQQVGDRQQRVELVEGRLVELKTTVQDLADKNENVDEISIMTEIKQAELAYEAALMATAKIAQQSLLNYL